MKRELGVTVQCARETRGLSFYGGIGRGTGIIIAFHGCSPRSWEKIVGRSPRTADDPKLPPKLNLTARAPVTTVWTY
jgi:hypothetical protein